jgi:signal transduction histidine kinase
MFEEILFLVIVLVVAALMAADVVRTRNEGLHGHVEGHAFDARRPVSAASLGSRESFSRAHAGTAMPVAVHDAGPAQRPVGASPSAGADPRSQADAVAVPRASRRRLKDWHVRSRLALLVIVPLAAAAVIALCVVYIIDVLRGTQVNSNGSVLSALAAGVAVVVAALASWFTIATARSVLRPLYRLRTGALELTGGRLAEAVRSASQSNGSRDGAPFDLKPVGVDAFDEIGDIARAFDELRREFLRLAVGESAQHGKLNTTFVDLSHRGQSLMERQIRLVQHLEQGEPDAQRLATLVRVKSIGNRMHRHSENLLILAGHEPSGHWDQPVALANVIRAAVSEVEEYQRVSVNAQPDVAVVGPAVNDVVHLLIELTENATSFSAADMQVDISGRALTSGGVLLQITDRGVGMTPKELAYANWRLENPPTADATVPKWIGLLVVARLAARHGIGVRLQSADFGGLTAMVWLPDEVLTEPGAMASRLGGFASAGSRRGLHEAVSDPGYATAQREVATARFTPTPAGIRDTTLDRRPVPGAGQPSAEPWSPSAARSALRAGAHATAGSPVSEPPEAGRDAPAPGGSERSQVAGTLPGTAAPVSQGTSPVADDVIVPPVRDLEGEQRLPVYNSVESRWFGEGRRAPSLPSHTAAAGSRWSSPADAGWRAASAADSPSSTGSTAAGLPKRAPNANLVPGTIPSAQPVMPNRSPAAARERLASLQRGVDKGRAATGQVTSPGEDEKAQPGSPA